MVEHLKRAFAPQLNASALTLVHDKPLAPLRVRPDVLLASQSHSRCVVLEVNEHRHTHGPGFAGTFAPTYYGKHVSFAALLGEAQLLVAVPGLVPRL